MKTSIITVVVFLITAISFAQQPYKTIFPNSERYFINQSGSIRAVEIESVYVSGMDTIYENFKSIRPDSVNCQWGLSADGASWMGEKIIIRPDGKNLFINGRKDTITIETLAGINDSWGLFRFANGDWLEATVTLAGIQTVLGVTDSVKVIGLQLKDNLGIPLQHGLNSKSFVISKSHGLIKTFDIYEFPNDTIEYQITDKKRLTVGEVYDFEVGDERQIKITSGSDFYPLVKEYILNIIIDKEFSGDSDTLFYKVKRKTIRYTYYPDSLWHYSDPDEISISEDTVQESYTRLDDPVLAFMPEESSIKDFDLWDYTLQTNDTIYEGGRFMIYHNYGYYFIETDSCWHQPTDASFYQTTYIEGLGRLLSSGYFSGSYEEELIYYKKGQEIFGQLFTALNEPAQAYVSVSVHPNPLTQTATLEYTLQQEETLSIRLLDLQGKTIRTFLENTIQDAGQHQQAIALPESLPAGSYLITISSPNGRMSVKIIK